MVSCSIAAVQREIAMRRGVRRLARSASCALESGARSRNHAAQLLDTPAARVLQLQVNALVSQSSSALATIGRTFVTSATSELKQSVSEQDFDVLKQFLMEPTTEGDSMEQAVKMVRKMMEQHVYASMPGQEATVMVMVADAMQKYPFVLEVYACLRDAYVSPSPLTLELTAKACAQLGEWQTASQVIEYMHDAVDIMHPSQDIYENAVLACHRANKWIKAKQLLDEMRKYGLEASDEIHFKCIALCVTNNELTATRVLLDKFIAIAMLEGRDLEELLAKLFRVAVEARSMDQALFFRDRMAAVGMPLSKEICEDLVQVCAAENEWEKAREVLAQYLKRPAPVALPSYAYTKGVTALLNDMHREALAIRLSTFNAAMRSYGRHSMHDQAARLMETMKQRGVTPDATSYAALMHACGTRVMESHQYFQEMKAQGQPLTADAVFAYLLAPSRAREWQIVLDRFETVDKNTTDPRLLSLVAVAHARLGDHKQMLQVFTHMKMKGLQPNLYVYGEALFAYIHLDQWRHALMLFDHIHQEGAFEARVLTEFSMLWDAAVLAAVNGEQTDRVAKLYDTIVQQNASISPGTAVKLVEHLTSVPVETLWDSFRKMPQLHRVRKNPSRSNPRVFNAVLLRAVNVNDDYLAEKLVFEAEDDMKLVFNSMTYSLMLRLFAQCEDSLNFQVWCDKMTNANVKRTVFAYRALLSHLPLLMKNAQRDRTFIHSIQRLLNLSKSDLSRTTDVMALAEVVLESMAAQGLAPDALCLEHYLRLASSQPSIDQPMYALRVLEILENASEFEFTTTFLYALFVSLGNSPEGYRVRKFLIECLDTLPQADDALVAYCSANDAEETLLLLQELLDQEHEIEDQQVLLFLTSTVVSGENATEQPVTSHLSGQSALARMCDLLVQSSDLVQLESSSMAFLIKQIVALSSSTRATEQENELEAVQRLLVCALRDYSSDQVRQFLTLVVSRENLRHLQSVLAALEDA